MDSTQQRKGLRLPDDHGSGLDVIKYPSARRGVPSGLLQEASRHSVPEIDHHGLQLRLTLCSKHLYRRVILI